jgi:hypothetical protein
MYFILSHLGGNSLSIGHAEMEKEMQKTVKEVNRENMS